MEFEVYLGIRYYVTYDSGYIIIPSEMNSILKLQDILKIQSSYPSFRDYWQSIDDDIPEYINDLGMKEGDVIIEINDNSSVVSRRNCKWIIESLYGNFSNDDQITLHRSVNLNLIT